LPLIKTIRTLSLQNICHSVKRKIEKFSGINAKRSFHFPNNEYQIFPMMGDILCHGAVYGVIQLALIL